MTARTPCPRAGCATSRGVDRRVPARHRRRTPLSRRHVSHRRRARDRDRARGRRRVALHRRPLARSALRGVDHRAAPRRSGCASPGSWSQAPPERAEDGCRGSVCKRCGHGGSLLARHDRSAGSAGAGIGGCDAPLRPSCPGSRTTRGSTTSRRAASSSTRAAAGARATSAKVLSSCCSRSGARRRCASCCCAYSATRTRTAIGRSGSCSSSASAASARKTRTATSCSGRCSHSHSTCWPPAMTRCSTRSCRSSMPRATRSAQHASVLAHVERALALIERRVIPGTRLAAYGHGDWNDSLQPADPALADELCSAWTVTLALPDDRDLWRKRCAQRDAPRGARREAGGLAGRHSRRLPASARWPTASLPASCAFATAARWRTGCIRTTETRACTTACCRWSTRSSRTSSLASRPCGTSS